MTETRRQRPPHHASRLSRLGAQILDGIVPAAVLLLLLVPAALLDGDEGGGTLMHAWVILAIVVTVGYYFFADALPRGQSIGKRWLGLAVIDATSGAPCTAGQSFVRNLCLALLGPIDWIFVFGERHQRLGDMLAGTIVIEFVPAAAHTA